MALWRISNHADLSGLGGERLSARWHSATAGKRIVYLAEHPALALIENLVSLRGNPYFFPDFFQLIKISSPAPTKTEELTPRQLKAIDPMDHETTRSIGDAWLTSLTSALLRVPSIPAPESSNYLLNPLHPHAASLKLEWARPIAYDKRLFHLGR